MKNLTELTPNESSNTLRYKSNLTPFEVAEIQQMQAKIYAEDEYLELENQYDDEN